MAVLVVDPSWSPLLIAIIASASALLGATIGARIQVVLDDRRALRERRAGRLDRFMVWAHGRTGIYTQAIRLAYNRNIDQAWALIERAEEEDPFFDTAWRSTSGDFRAAARTFIQADEVARERARQFINRAEQLQQAGAVQPGDEPSPFPELGVAERELDAAADRYLIPQRSWWQLRERKPPDALSGP